MSNNAYARTAAGMFDTLNRRLTAVERRLPPPLYVPPVPTPTQGTTAVRDAYFGTPATDADRVALANQRVRYWNTDLGWEESYYAVTGLSGLTAKGLIAGTASGWYPVGPGGPMLACYPTTTTSLSAGNNLSGWSGSSDFSRGGTAWIEYTGSGTIQVKVAGRYRVRWRTTVQTGSGAMDMWIYAGTVFANDAWELNSSFYKTMDFEFTDVALAANATCYAKANSGGPVTMHISSSTRRGEFVVEYLGPNLVSD